MAIFKIENNKIDQLGLQIGGFGSEFKLRDFFAENLEEILGVRFLEKEYPTTDGGRIDTLGIDENNSPVIIEYKWKENEEALQQGLSYLNWLLNNKKHFELLVKGKLGFSAEISWDQPRVIVIAQGFSRRTQGAVQQVKNFELKTYNLYEGGILQIENVYTPVGIKEKKITKTKVVDPPVSSQYNLEYHLNLTSPEARKSFSLLREKLLELPEVIENTDQKSGITYKTTKSFARFEFKPTWIQLLVREAEYKEDVQKLVRDVTTHGWGYRGVIKFTPETDIAAVFEVIRSSYESTL